MILLLNIIGVVIIFLSVISGLLFKSILIFFLTIFGAVPVAIIFFALARILENQDDILYNLQYQEKVIKRSQKQENKICLNCNCSYDSECNTCPHCGHSD